MFPGPRASQKLAAEFHTYGNLIRVDIAEKGKRAFIENIERRKISMGKRTSANKPDHKVPKLKEIYITYLSYFFCNGREISFGRNVSDPGHLNSRL